MPAIGPYEPTEALVGALASGHRRGAIGPGPLLEHIRHASAFVDASGLPLDATGPLLDLGTGGGLPGLVIADRLTQLRCTLLDGRTERVRGLNEELERLGWAGRVSTVAARAEEAAHRPELRHRFDVVVARAFGPPAVTAECGAAFLRPGGLLVVSEPPGTDTERWPAAGCARVGLDVIERLTVPWSFVVLAATSRCDDRLPRRVGIPTKRPLF